MHVNKQSGGGMPSFSGVSVTHVCNQLKCNDSVADDAGNVHFGFTLALHALNHFKSTQDREKILGTLCSVEDPGFDPLQHLDHKGTMAVSAIAKALPKHSILTSDNEDVVISVMNAWQNKSRILDLRESDNPAYIFARNGNFKAAYEAVNMGFSSNADLLSEMLINGFPQKHAVKKEESENFIEYCGLNLVRLVSMKAINPNFCHRMSGQTLYDVVRNEGNEELQETILAAALKTKIMDMSSIAENIENAETKIKQSRSTARMM